MKIENGSNKLEKEKRFGDTLRDSSAIRNRNQWNSEMVCVWVRRPNQMGIKRNETEHWNFSGGKANKSVRNQ